eukprot:GEMP01077167.1.p1 GENE.GEMP01077167.1~~GEMP01077167.1.p1  ORF type:complete len:208 (+),score=43.78 GEMP01077167.1:303-926(+)
MKRARATGDESSSSKRTRKEGEAIAVLAKIQTELSNLDEKCAQEQIATQQKYDTQKKPHLQKRRDVLKRIPGFWKDTLLRLPNMETEEEALNYLEEIVLEDNLDQRGSHTFTLKFAENPYFTNEVLTKQIRVQEDNSDEVTAPTIDWKRSSPRQESSNSLRKCQGGLFSWLQSSEIADDDFGTTFRETIWEDPYSIYVSDQHEDSEG